MRGTSWQEGVSSRLMQASQAGDPAQGLVQPKGCGL